MASKWKTSRTMDPGQRAAHTAHDKGLKSMQLSSANFARAFASRKGHQMDPGRKARSTGPAFKRGKAAQRTKGRTMDPGQRARRKRP